MGELKPAALIAWARIMTFSLHRFRKEAGRNLCQAILAVV
jgi:hypothetical protein